MGRDAFAWINVYSKRCSRSWTRLSFIHEIGHSVGAQHDPDNTSATASETVTPYAFGHTDMSVDPSVATIMSYGAKTGSTRADYFSTVRVSPGGWTLGINGERDNEAVMRKMAPRVARPSDYGQPLPPTYLDVFPLDSTSIKLKWGDNSDDEDGFIVSYRPIGDPDWSQHATGPDVAKTTVKGLDCGAEYLFRVRAQNALGRSPTTDKVRVGPLGRPDAPDGLRAVPAWALKDNKWVQSSTTAELRWGDSDDETSYRVIYRQRGADWNVAATLAADVTETTVTGLEPGERYDFRVRAKNDCGAKSSKLVSLKMPQD